MDSKIYEMVYSKIKKIIGKIAPNDAIGILETIKAEEVNKITVKFK